VIYCGNHRSHLDSLVLATAVATHGRRYLAFMAAGKVMASNPVLGLLKYLGGFPVFKENPAPALKYAELSLRSGFAVAIYPEGRRFASRKPSEGRTGVARILEKLNFDVPVIPFYIHGSREAIRGIKRHVRNRVLVAFDAPMHFQSFRAIKDSYQRLRSVTDSIVARITDLMHVTEAEILEKYERSRGILDFTSPTEYPWSNP
ncbi:MAG TPA: lysophospholipid acyltransferase family protein, partial [Candidatus Hodarchaeales archaeon]|nr:lysophospholipid acyltransferase family protein [Candidatus Hodarchaeales archaeon]